MTKGFVVNTPYDDVFRTMLNDCSSLIIPVINEIFNERYCGNEKIVFHRKSILLTSRMEMKQSGLRTAALRLLERKKQNFY